MSGEDEMADQRDYFAEYLGELYKAGPVFDAWRSGFRSHVDALAESISQCLNENRAVGFLEAPEVTASDLRNTFLSGPNDATPASYDQFVGSAVGELRLYTKRPDGSADEHVAPVRYSVWDPVSVGATLAQQKITACATHYVDPEPLPDISDKQTDLVLQDWMPDLGLVSWAHLFRSGDLAVRSLGYEIGDNQVGRLFWINQILNSDGLPSTPDVGDEQQLLLSIDYRANEGEPRVFGVFGVNMIVNLANGTARFTNPILKLRNTFELNRERLR